jgi:hypothetical protein
VRILSKAAVVAAALVSALALGSSPAAASSDVSTLGLSECPDNRVCLWDMVNYERLLVSIPASDVNCPFGAALREGAIDRANSIANNTGLRVRFYNYVGGSDPWQWIATLSAGGQASFNDQPEKKDRIDMVTTCDLG